MRTLVITCVWVLTLMAASAQEQERKLVDRLLKPDLSLQNKAQEKQFPLTAGGGQKEARTKSFYARARPSEKSFRNSGSYQTQEFVTHASRDAHAEARLEPSAQLAETRHPYPTKAFAREQTADEGGRAARVSPYAGTRPFLVRGKSQKALSAQDRPLTLDQVRELLNKNK